MFKREVNERFNFNLKLSDAHVAIMTLLVSSKGSKKLDLLGRSMCANVYILKLVFMR